MKVIFKFSWEREASRIVNLYKEIVSGWYQKMKYKPKVPPFSKEIHKQLMKEKNKNKREKIVNSELEKIFDEKVYKKLATKIDAKWKKVGTNFFEELKDLSVQVLSEYHCYISLYGMQGSYELPDELTVRCINSGDLSYINETIAHEILHLIFEDKMRDKKLSHLQKEGFIDYVMMIKFKKIFSKYQKQKLGIRANISLYREILNK